MPKFHLQRTASMALSIWNPHSEGAFSEGSPLLRASVRFGVKGGNFEAVAYLQTVAVINDARKYWPITLGRYLYEET
jgi:hypothetical protein